ncbi:LLM class flavin-dependent oxidoreductase [Pseudonocardia humida]|uniref:LLM class flavin-dependent oxidoreductase n=1 Tax=Pseudonocardia humida TaxID=2800819 RepID=A0ABT1A435_9PSEU|nr:LLM class flavin-dependent oxidoreductase [Pseudonocardia humida]MCO1657711.1 LLM class flavin-dependent oxidoreductase [Pseudonocardia humida]
MTAFTRARMHLGVEIDGAGHHPAAAGRTGADPRALSGVGHHLAMAMAARRGLDFVALPGGGETAALELATRIGPVVSGIDLLPAAPVTDVDDPTAALTAFAATSAGRVGWQPAPPGADQRWDEVARVVERVALRWSAPLRGSATPPLTVLRGDDPAALPVLARWADVVRISAPGLDAAHETRSRVRTAVAAAGRDPDDVAVLLDVEVHLAADRHRARAELARLDAVRPAPASSVRVLGPAGDLADLVGAALRLGAADGITLQPLVLPDDLRRVVDEAVPLLAGRGLLRSGWAGVLRRPGAGRDLVAAGAPWRQRSA